MSLAQILQQTGAIDSMARELNVDPQTARTAAGALLPAIVAGMGRQASGGAMGGAGAGGDPLGGLGGLIGGLGGGGLLDSVLGTTPTPTQPGNDILGQIFGSKDVSRGVADEVAGSTGLDPSLLRKVATILLLPFVLGQALQAWLRPFLGDHRRLITWLDRFAIAMAVYVAFSGAVVQGLWQRLDGAGWAVLLAGVAAMLAVGFGGAWLVAGLARFDRARRISFLFAGAHKSAAVGAPLALVLFPAGKAGMVMVPLLAYHLLQLMLSAPLASRLAAHGDHHPPRDDGVCSAPTTTATDRSGSPRSTR